MNRSLLLSFIVAMCCVLANAQSDWDTYPVRSISRMVAQEDTRETAKADMVISADPFPSKTRVVFTGKHRPLDVYSRNFLKLWADTRNVPAGTIDRLKEEVLVLDNGKEFWMPVDSEHAQNLLSVLKPNDEVQIYYFYVGGFNEKKIYYKTDEKLRTGSPGPDAFKWFFILENFDDPHPGQTALDSFTPQPLQQAIAKNNDVPQDAPSVWFSPHQTRSKTKLIYTGEVRPLSENRKELLSTWLDKNGFPANAAILMQNEARFLEGDKEFWIVMRNATLNDISQNVKKGGIVFLNTMLLGRIKSDSAVDWVFLCGNSMQN